MNAPGHARIYPLTLRWYLATWRGGARWHASRIRTHTGSHPETIGTLLSVLGFTLAVGRFGTAPLTTGPWFRDFGRRLGRYSIGGWRTVRPVPFSTGFMYGGGPDLTGPRIGILVTVASRTLCVYRLCTAAEYRHSRNHFGDLHRKRR